MYCAVNVFFIFQEESFTPEELELKELKDSLQDTQPVGYLVNHCKTVDQVIACVKCCFYLLCYYRFRLMS